MNLAPRAWQAISVLKMLVLRLAEVPVGQHHTRFLPGFRFFLRHGPGSEIMISLIIEPGSRQAEGVQKADGCGPLLLHVAEFLGWVFRCPQK